MYIVSMPSDQFDFVRATGCRPVSPGPDLVRLVH